MEHYTYHADGVWLIRESDQALVSHANPAYLAWLAEGNTPEPYVPPPAAPITVVDALQGLRAIGQAGLSAEYTLWVESPLRTFDEKAFINKAQTWKRDDPTLVAAAAELGRISLNG